ncbi:HAMP domain-containing histidine kinase [Zobellia sp. KMM 6746]|uniref:histidine kinase n=2 Tax=Zobellia barbeyronii TaxID=2748009 RepID=A0ABS5WCZ2_9FLAO|nr:HAMP domain-containing histidine kinase [Zobellia barbeyronii]
MIVSTITLYFYVKNLMRAEVEEELYSTTARVETILGENGTPFSLPPVVEVASVNFITEKILKDTVIYDPSQKEMEEFRELSTFKEINGTKYKITVRNLIVESENILIAIILSYVTIILLIFIFLFYLNKARNKKMWLPFFTNLEAMKNFSVTSDKALYLIDSEIIEFSEFKDEIEVLTNKVRSDYKNLKQYTEDVSHELQTPLAIIQAKIENIINGDGLNDIQFEHLTSIQRDIQRLTQMNKRLTLLTKIENNQFVNMESVDMNLLVEKTVKNFQELSNVQIKISGDANILAAMDPYLAEVLCNNLISNALKHSDPDGTIDINFMENMYSISNSGSKPLEHPENLYSRFYRESEAIKSTGLGLAIVKRICDIYKFDINYTFKSGRHIFTVKF